MSPFLNPTYIIAVLIAISVHEWAHAMVAHRFGDPTAEAAGRLTLNPIAHLDLVGALLFITVGFGWAKPVPVDARFFKKPLRDMAIVAAAGPLSNFILAFVSFILLTVIAGRSMMPLVQLLQSPTGMAAWLMVLTMILQASLYVNLALMAFNLFPLAPLDGSNMIRLFIPRRHLDRYEDFVRISPFILLFLVLFESVIPFPIISAWVQGIMGFVLNAFELLVG